MSFDGYMQITNIKGDSTDDGHKDWIELLSFNHKVTQGAGGSGSGQGAHTGGRADHDDFEITHVQDVSSPALLEHCCSGKAIDEVVIELCRAGGDKVVFTKYTMKKVIVACVAPTGDHDAELLPQERVCFRYASIHIDYTATDKMGKAGATFAGGWSTEENKPA